MATVERRSRGSIGEELAAIRAGVRAVRLEQVSRELRHLARARQAAGQTTPAGLAHALSEIEQRLIEARAQARPHS